MSKKQKDKHISASIVKTIALIVVLALAYQSIKLVKISHSLDQQIKETSKEVAKERRNLEALQMEYENIESLKNVEKLAREKLGMVKEDEIVFREKY